MDRRPVSQSFSRRDAALGSPARQTLTLAPFVRGVEAVGRLFVIDLPLDEGGLHGGPVVERRAAQEQPVEDRPDEQLVDETRDTWFLSVLGPGASRGLVDVEQALAATRNTQQVADELKRLEQLLPVLHRAGAMRRGQVYLSTNEAWEFMTRDAPTLSASGFEVRLPALSRRGPGPTTLRRSACRPR